jgi:hypothetical protein
MTTEPMIEYKVELNVYDTVNSFVGRCNAIAFLNRGTSIAVVNNVELFPGEPLAIDGNRNEFDKTVYNIGFRPLPGSENKLVVIRKVYSNG